MRSGDPPIGTVLVPTDFSPGANDALARAMLLPLAPKARVHLVHVLPTEASPKVREKAAAIAAERLGQLAAQARQQAAVELNITSQVLMGEAFAEIIRCSRHVDADLIVIGRHGHRPLKDMFIGTTAERVIRKGDVPVLAVTLKPQEAYCRPIIATDLSDASLRTFDLALRVLGPEAQNISIVHAFHAPFEGFVSPIYSAREKSEYHKEFRAKAHAGLDALLAHYHHTNVRWSAVIRPGGPCSVIQNESARVRADLIALGTHARAGVARALVGSVAEWVIAAAACDVLVARPIRFSFELP